MNVEKPSVSVIVPNYNHASYLKQRIDSVLNQTYQDFELILLDDCSTDNSIEILQEYSNHSKVSHFIVNKKNTGSPFTQWQKGIELARGEFIWIAESDDSADNKLLEYLIAAFAKANQKSEIGLLYCQSIVIDESSREIRTWADRWTKSIETEQNIEFTGSDYIERYMLFENTIPNASAVLFRRDLTPEFIQIKKMKLNGDWLFWILMLSKNNGLFVNTPLNYFRQHFRTARSKNIQTGLNLIEQYTVLNHLNDAKYIKNKAPIREKQKEALNNYLTLYLNYRRFPANFSLFLISTWKDYPTVISILLSRLFRKFFNTKS